MVGIIQEQHPDRCELFMQWKQMDWPIMVDSFNELGVTVVPIHLLIDEHGIIREIVRERDPQRMRQVVDAFLEADFANITIEESPTRKVRDVDSLRQTARSTGTAEAWRELGAELAKWAAHEELGQAIDALKTAVQTDPNDALVHFQLGVAYRMRFDSPIRQSQDFQNASEHWSQAMALNPNQYIWRRRIEQYGPRLTKPYSFYDWVQVAREEITQRSETAVKLHVEPSGAEYANPVRSFSEQDADQAPPADLMRIEAVQPNVIDAQVTVVPARIRPGDAARVHVMFKPVAGAAHWNNEVDPLRLWVDAPDGWQVSQRGLIAVQGDGATSSEPRQLEFEVRAPADATGQTTLTAHALYYMCLDADGVCLYRRHSLNVKIVVEKK